MDRSMDSIGNCSLDVDADTSDKSETSDSLQLLSDSVKSIQREFIVNAYDHCSILPFHNTKVVIDQRSNHICTELTQPVGNIKESVFKNAQMENTSLDKKPSYLSLACCVNGYSNLTTYDSKIRQDINKSREVSPIRPSTCSIQYCKKNNSLAPPLLLSMSDVCDSTEMSQHVFSADKQVVIETNNNRNNVTSSFKSPNAAQADLGTSFIQQRVERLYGPGALAQNFYSPKKSRGTHIAATHVEGPDNVSPTELLKKFKDLSANKGIFNNIKKKLHVDNFKTYEQHIREPVLQNVENNHIDIPVFRHLSEEFRAQLPALLTNKQYMKNSHSKDDLLTVKNGGEKDLSNLYNETDEVDHKSNLKNDSLQIGETNLLEASPVDAVKEHNEITSVQDPVQPISKSDSKNWHASSSACASTSIDGFYFLNLLKTEQNRILLLADEVDNYMELLANNPMITEDVMGLLRSASGKARLLVSQKMKQFEGLCQNNLNSSPQDKFPTTVDDLQGFWDMVNLQIEQVNTIFAEIEVLKKNEWKIMKDAHQPKAANKQQKFGKPENHPVKATSSIKNDSTPSTTKSSALLKREQQRKQLLEIKRKNRLAMAGLPFVQASNQNSSNLENSNPVNIVVNNNS